jgi:hypothetical protein
MGYIGGIWAAAALIFCHFGHIFSLSHLNDLLVDYFITLRTNSAEQAFSAGIACFKFKDIILAI